MTRNVLIRASIFATYMSSFGCSHPGGANSTATASAPTNSGSLAGRSPTSESRPQTPVTGQTAGVGPHLLPAEAGSSAGQTGSAGRVADATGGMSGFMGDARPADDSDAGASGSGGTKNDDVPPAPVCKQDSSASAPCHACVHQGLVAGSVKGSNCRYLGIPYAEPPKGPRRFSPPEPASGWSGVRQATEFGPACPQVIDASGSGKLDEDCLYLNVWAPASAPTAPLPVMVFVPGGAFVAGASNPLLGDGLADRGVVYVSLNYRLGPLGFFAHPELDKERPAKPSGSDGIRDQQLALQWVRENIASFHGDPNNVTLFGESAGSSSVSIHLVSPASRKLVRRYLMESGVALRDLANGIAAIPRATMYQRTAGLVSDLCPRASDVMACLRGLSADALIQWTPSTASTDPGVPLVWVPVVEGPGGVLSDTPDALIAKGDINPGEVLVGTNRNEYSFPFGLLGGPIILTGGDLRTQLTRDYGAANVDKLMAIYAPNASDDANQAYTTLMTDIMFRCSTRRLARGAAAAGRNVYLYSFEQPDSFGDSYHGAEVGLVFGPGNFTLDMSGGQFDTGLSNTIQQYWVNFANAGDPNGMGLPGWPKYDMTTDQHMRLAAPPEASMALRKAACDFWDDYVRDTAP